MGLLNSQECLVRREFVFEELNNLPVAQGRERTRRFAILGNKFSRLFHQSGGEHGANTSINALVKFAAGGVKANPENSKSTQRLAPLLPLQRNRCARGKT